MIGEPNSSEAGSTNASLVFVLETPDHKTRSQHLWRLLSVLRANFQLQGGSDWPQQDFH